MRVSLAGFIQCFLLKLWQKPWGLSENRLGRRNIFSPSAKIALMILKAYTGLSDRHLVEHLNGNIHYQKRLSIIKKVLVQEKDLFEGVR